jgi:uncharacterized protein YdaU (DUF1376 family)
VFYSALINQGFVPMSDMTWVRFCPSDWLAGTRGLTAAETGIYITLVANMYERAGPLPNSIPRLARLCGVPNVCMKNALRVLIEEGKIVECPGGIINNRVRKELDRFSDKSSAAKASANARWARLGTSNARTDPLSYDDETLEQDKEKPNKNNDGFMRTQCERNANQKLEARSQKESSVVSDSEPCSGRAAFDDLETKLRSAAGVESNPSPGLFVLSPILGLIDAGFDLEADILPIIRARSKTMNRPPGSWAYFVAAIQDAKGQRQQAGAVQRKATGPSQDNLRNGVRLWAEGKMDWPIAWGPEPGEPGCRVAPDVLARFPEINQREVA